MMEGRANGWRNPHKLDLLSKGYLFVNARDDLQALVPPPFINITINFALAKRNDSELDAVFGIGLGIIARPNDSDFECEGDYRQYRLYQDLSAVDSARLRARLIPQSTIVYEISLLP